MYGKTIIINLFGEPCAGKSTMAMDITAKLKRLGIETEFVSEFAKDKFYENNTEVFKHQEYIFGKQSFKIGRVNGKVQVIVVDSPLLLPAIYNDDPILGEDFNKIVLKVFKSYNNKNYFLKRDYEYNHNGRFQTEDESKIIRNKIGDKLKEFDIDYEIVSSSEETAERIVSEISKEVKSNEQ